jgi:hypothetical protein
LLRGVIEEEIQHVLFWAKDMARHSVQVLDVALLSIVLIAFSIQRG